MSQASVQKRLYRLVNRRIKRLLLLFLALLTFVPPVWICVPFSTSSILAQTPEAQIYQANLLLNLGIRQHKTGQFAAALESLHKALALYQNLGDDRGIANTLGSLGDTYFSIGQYEQSVGFYHQSWIVTKVLGDRIGEVEALVGLSNAYLYLGQEARAKKFEQQAQVIRREIGNPRRQAAFLHNLALDSESQGEYQQAIAFHQQQLKIARETNNPSLEAESLQKLAQVYELSGQYQQAIELYQQQLEFAKKSNDSALTVVSLNQLANAYQSLGQYPQAVELYQQELELARKSSNSVQEAIALNRLATAYESQGQYEKAIELYQQQLEVAKKSSNRLVEGTALNNLALAYLKANNLTEVQPKLLNALKVWDAIRTLLGSKDNYYPEQARTYRLLQQILITQNQPEAALEMAEQGRVKAILELLNLRLSSEPVGMGLNAAPPQIILPTTQDIKQIAKAQNATLVEYSIISDSELYVWVIQPTGELTFRRIDIKSQKTVYPIASLQEVVSNSLESIGVKGKTNTSATEPTDKTTQNQSLLQLHQVLIKPIEDLLPKDSKERVIFIPQAELFFVPFPALVDITGKYLIEKHTILTSPSIQVLALTKQQRKRVSGDKVIVIGNPTMPNMSVEGGKSSQSLPPLLRGEQEALEIAQLLKTTALISNQATKSAFLQQLPNARTIHLATYGLLDDMKRQGVPGGIALAPSGNDNGILTAAEILNLYEQTKDKKSPLRAELVVLSSGNTGNGNLSSDGLMGLSLSLIAAGVPSVILSLGSASDASTTELMVEFYRQLKQTGNKAQALRQAMLIVMKQYPDSKQWAAFTLIGEAQ
jgi:CHAT domain-containing protein